MTWIWQTLNFDSFWPRALKTGIARIARWSHTEVFPKSGHIYQLWLYHTVADTGKLRYQEAVYVQLSFVMLDCTLLRILSKRNCVLLKNYSFCFMCELLFAPSVVFFTMYRYFRLWFNMYRYSGMLSKIGGTLRVSLMVTSILRA